MTKPPVTVKCKFTRVGEDVRVTIFELEISYRDKKGIWCETYGTMGEANAFLKGLTAAFPDGFRIPQIIQFPGGSYSLTDTI